MRTPKNRCRATAKSTGRQCGNPAIRGGTVCDIHGGRAPAVKAKAAIRAELAAWSLTDATIDPGEQLLRLVTQSAARAEMYARELKTLVDESPSLREALVAEIWISTEHDRYKAGEYICGLAKLEAEERDRCASFCTKAVAAGLVKKQTELAQIQGEVPANRAR
jgi:hypothetical protein